MLTWDDTAEAPMGIAVSTSPHNAAEALRTKAAANDCCVCGGPEEDNGRIHITHPLWGQLEPRQSATEQKVRQVHPTGHAECP